MENSLPYFEQLLIPLLPPILSRKDILLLEAILNSEPLSPLPNHANYFPEVRKELKICEAKPDETSIDEPPEVKLKDLPPHLEYAFLEGNNKLPVLNCIKDLCCREKAALIQRCCSPQASLRLETLPISKGLLTGSLSLTKFNGRRTTHQVTTSENGKRPGEARFGAPRCNLIVIAEPIFAMSICKGQLKFGVTQSSLHRVSSTNKWTSLSYRKTQKQGHNRAYELEESGGRGGELGREGHSREAWQTESRIKYKGTIILAKAVADP
ncbi:hypothetical protein Tco_0307738 [Tanacetum coccineum]